MEQVPNNIIISRTDSIGDVVLTLPVAAVLKKHFPGLKIGFLGRAYTKPVIEACSWVDEFIDLGDFMQSETTVCGEAPEAILHVFPVRSIAQRAKQLDIPLRVGTWSRLYHLATCNRLVTLSRRRSPLHEAQLNLELLNAFGIDTHYPTEEIGQLFGLERLAPLPDAFAGLLSKDAYNLILHPKSQGSAREWGLDNFIRLVRLLDPARYRVFISGTAKERVQLQPLFDSVGDRVTDITGQMPLGQFISFISRCDGLVANSTGPLHIAAALGRDAFGIYPAIRPMHPGRWAPLGPGAHAYAEDRQCSDCRNDGKNCHCIAAISPMLIQHSLDKAAGLVKAAVITPKLQ